MTTEASPKALRRLVCYYEFPRPEGYKATASLGNLRIDDPDDPRWDDMLQKSPYHGDPQGCIVIAEETSVENDEGKLELVKRKAIKGGPCHINKARETMYEFKRLLDSGSKTPWDQERHFRDTLAEAERLKLEGREAELGLVREALLALTKAQTVAVSSGSPVMQAGTAVPTTTAIGKETKK